jgi:hypothetical protein
MLQRSQRKHMNGPLIADHSKHIVPRQIRATSTRRRRRWRKCHGVDIGPIDPATQFDEAGTGTGIPYSEEGAVCRGRSKECAGVVDGEIG